MPPDDVVVHMAGACLYLRTMTAPRQQIPDPTLLFLTDLPGHPYSSVSTA